jgi:hypothetical protein
VLLALILIGVVAAVIFLSARRRLSTWMFLAAIGLLLTCGLAWSREPSHRHAPIPRKVVLAPAVNESTDPLQASPSQTAGSHGKATITFVSSDSAPPVDTGSGPNHEPALALAAVGTSVGLAGFVVRRRKPVPTP